MSTIKMFNSQILEDAEPIGEEFASPINPEISFLTKNSSLPQDVSDEDFSRVEGFSTYYYSTNDIVVKLEDNTPENLVQFDVNSDGTVPVFAFVYLKTKLNPSDSTIGYQRVDFFNAQTSRFDIFDVVSINSERTQIEITFKDDKFAELYEIMRGRGLEVPEFGVISFRIPFVQSGRKFTQVFMMKYTDRAILTTPPTVETDEPDEISFTTSPHTFETFFIPTLTASFVYNFYETNEESLVAAARRDYSLVDFRQVPKFVKLTWNKAPILPTSFYSNLSMLQEYFRNLNILGRIDPGLLVIPPPPPPEPEPPRSGESFSVGDSSFIEGVFFSGPSSNVGRTAAIIQNSGRNSRISSDLFDVGLGSEIREGTTESTVPSIPTVRPGIFDEEDIDRLTGVSEEIRDQLDRVTTSPILDEVLNTIPEIMNDHSRYIGYVLIKEILDDDGTTIPVDMIVIPDINTTHYFDYKIAYGKTYRYKIRSIFKFVNRNPSIANIIQDTDATIRTSGSAQFYFGQVRTINSHYFDSEFSDAVDVEALEFDRPKHPELQVYPNSEKKEVFLTWTQKDSSRDVSGYNVYRKKISDLNFTKLNQEPISKRNNFYTDIEVQPDVEYVYAVESIDYHFNFSKLSNQIVCKIGYYNVQSSERCEAENYVLKPAGLEIGEDLVVFSKYKYFKKKFKIIANPVFNKLRENVVYVLKIKSLDTGEEKEIKLNFKSLLINTEPVRVRQEFDEILQTTVREQDRVAQVGNRLRQDLISNATRGRF